MAAIFELAVFDLKRRSLNTAFGAAWALVNPLMQIFILYFVMTFLAKSNLENLHVWLLANMSIWLFLQSSAQKGCRSLLDRRGLIQNSNIEMSKFVKADVLAEYLVFLAFFAAATAFSAGAGILTWQMTALLPIFLVVLYSFSYGLGLIFATITVFLRDLPYVVGIIFQVLFWLSPVAYPRLELSGPLRVVVDFNPLTYIIELGQAVVYSGVSRPAPLFIAATVSIAVFVAGNFVFSRLARKSVVTL